MLCNILLTNMIVGAFIFSCYRRILFIYFQIPLISSFLKGCLLMVQTFSVVFAIIKFSVLKTSEFKVLGTIFTDIDNTLNVMQLQDKDSYWNFRIILVLTNASSAGIFVYDVITLTTSNSKLSSFCYSILYTTLCYYNLCNISLANLQLYLITKNKT